MKLNRADLGFYLKYITPIISLLNLSNRFIPKFYIFDYHNLYTIEITTNYLSNNLIKKVMGSDKISSILEKYLKTLGQKIRIDILKILINSQVPLSYSLIEKKVLEDDSHSINLSFHLKALKDQDLIRSTDRGYSLTSLGDQILEKMLSMEQIILNDQKTIMIRTSKYSIEPLNMNKIENYLIQEGKMEPYLAKKVTQEIKKRISKLDIEYLTAPLMREYINSILVEMGFEEYRKNLTRLGTPPYDVFKLFERPSCSPESFLRILGSESSEQFLLLNLLPHHLSDLFLSGEIALLNLNTWHLKPLSIFLETKTILNILSNPIKKANTNPTIKTFKDLNLLILSFFKRIDRLFPYFGQDIILRNFSQDILSICPFSDKETLKYLIKLIKIQCGGYNNTFYRKNHIGIDFTDNSNIKTATTDHKFDSLEFSNLFIEPDKDLDCFRKEKSNFLLLFDRQYLKDWKQSDSFKEIGNRLSRKNILFTNSNSIIDSSLVKPQKVIGEANQIVLDKILINLFLIALKAKQNDDLFFTLLRQKIDNVFDFFKHKIIFLRKKNDSFACNSIFSSLLWDSKEEIYKKAIKSISFFGLNSAVKFHCGIELDKVKQSEKFALDIIEFMKNCINEENRGNQENYILTQPHYGDYLESSWNKTKISLDNKKNYSNHFISPYGTIPLKKRISLFKKFDNVVNGGTLFSLSLENEDQKLKNVIDLVLDSNINTFEFCKELL